MACECMDREDLAAWVDDALPTAEAAAVAAHVAACPHCAARVAELRAHKARLTHFREATTPAALPVDFWERTRAALDRIDVVARPSGLTRRPGPPHWRHLAGVAAIVAVVLALALAAGRRTILPPVVPVALLMAQPLPPPGGVALNTNDADRAASWLGEQLNARIPPVNLSLTGARMVSARADRDAAHGILIYRGVEGVPITLHLFLAPGATVPPLPALTYRGSGYRVATRKTPPAAAVAWQTESRTFVAAAPLPLARLLPYVHEMDRACRLRR